MSLLQLSIVISITLLLWLILAVSLFIRGVHMLPCHICNYQVGLWLLCMPLYLAFSSCTCSVFLEPLSLDLQLSQEPFPVSIKSNFSIYLARPLKAWKTFCWSLFSTFVHILLWSFGLRKCIYIYMNPSTAIWKENNKDHTFQSSCKLTLLVFFIREKLFAMNIFIWQQRTKVIEIL